MSEQCRLWVSSHLFWSFGVAWVCAICMSSLNTLIKNMLQLGSTEITLWCTLLHVIAWSCFLVYFGIKCGWGLLSTLGLLSLFLLHLQHLWLCGLFAHIFTHKGLVAFAVCLNRRSEIVCIFAVWYIHRFSVAQKPKEINLIFWLTKLCSLCTLV